MKTKNFNSERGIVALPVFIGLAFMAVALAVGIGLVQRNQNLQNRASSATTFLNVGQGDCFKTPCRSGLVCSKGVCVLSSIKVSTCKSQGGSCKRYNVLNVAGFNISSVSKTRCQSGLVDVGQTTDCKGLAQTCCVPKPKVTPIPTLVPTPVVSGTCGWCGTSCIKTRPDTMCTMVMPPANQTCTTASDDTCVIKNLGLITKPTVAVTTKPANTICAWCGAGCKEVRNDIDFSIQCPTVNIAAPIGGNVTQTCARLTDGTCGIQTVPKISSVPIGPSPEYAY